MDDQVAWASGAEGTWLRTLDGGANWHAGRVPHADALDFRGVRAFDRNLAYLLSSGAGEKSRVYKTTDGGAGWTLLFTNPDAAGFFDALAFWDPNHGILLGDPVAGHAVIYVTSDGGRHWSRRSTPPSLLNEGAFAASNSCLVVSGRREAWFATGGPGAARAFHSPDQGVTWTVAPTPLRNDSSTAGIFSLQFSDPRHGVAVGGDYAHDSDALRTIAWTSDGGATWKPLPPDQGPRGYRSTLVYLPDRRVWLTAGTSGSDISRDGGKTWHPFDTGPFHAIGARSSHAVYAVGPKGRIARLQNLR